MGKGKTFVQDYEVNLKNIKKSIEENLCENYKEKNTNKIPKKKKRKK
jgi:hypothetical protein